METTLCETIGWSPIYLNNIANRPLKYWKHHATGLKSRGVGQSGSVNGKHSVYPYGGTRLKKQIGE